MTTEADAWVLAGHANFIDTNRALSQLFPDGVAEEVEGAVCVWTGMAFPEFNTVFAFGKPHELGPLAERIEHLYRHNRTPWELLATAQSRDGYLDLIRDLGLVMKRRVPGMLLEPYPRAAPRLPTDLTVREVTDENAIGECLRTSSVAFGGPPDAFDFVVDRFASQVRARNSSMHLYVGWNEERPVAAAIRYTSHRLAGIFSVATLPEFRRRGFGEAITWRAAMDGIGEGCAGSYLQATEMGQRVYERMGYRVVAEYEEWVPSLGR